MNFITTIKLYIEQLYQGLYGEEFIFSEKYTEGKMVPSWLWVDENLSIQKSLQESGVIVDPEIGTCLFILPYQENKLKSQIAKALNYRSKLFFEYAPNASDQNGAWKVIIHWYVRENQFANWSTQIGNIRKNSSQIEEIPVDAIIYNDDNMYGACKKYQFSRLLINTRMILSKTDFSEMEKWSSVNDKIKEAVVSAQSKLVNEIEDKIHKQIFSEIFTFMDELSEIKEVPSSLTYSSKKLSSLIIKDFRNINHLEMSFDYSDGVTSSVLHGPNGTGKSSIFEALSFGIGKTSTRFLKYLNDKNHTERNSYLDNYLSSMGAINRTPLISINNELCSPDTDHDVEESKHRLFSMSGTFLSQEQSVEFTTMQKQDLGNMIIGQSSTFAVEITSFIESRYNTIREFQKEFLKKYNINAQVKKIETASEKIIDTYLQSVFVKPSPFLNWLEKDSFKDHEVFMPFLGLKDEWDLFIAQRNDYLASMMKSIESSQERLIVDFLTKKNMLLRKSHDFYQFIELESKALNFEIIQDLQNWAHWVKMQNDKNTDQLAEVIDINSKVNELKTILEKIIYSSIQLKFRAEHIQTAINFMEVQHWTNEHHDECPTCGSNLSDREGAEQAIKALFLQTQKESLALQEKQNELSNEIKVYETRLVELGESKNPISHDRQTEIIKSLLWLLPKNISFNEYIISEQNIEYIISLVKDIQIIQPISERELTDAEINSTAIEKIEWLKKEMNNIKENFIQERAWTSVKKALQVEILAIIEHHLPNTFQALWLEIAKNLTPAPWQYRGNIQLDATTKNNHSSVTVDFVGKADGKVRLAHYILNGAEIHVLGLAWFFTRYLTYGRFQNAFIIMDDPAQEMDQHTFKDLCRFLESLIRLHKIKTIPCTMITMLHQDERAFELVKTLNGLLYQLRWNNDGDVDLTMMKLVNDQFKAPYPNFLQVV